MIRHIVMWNFKDTLHVWEQQESAQKMKQLLEELPSLIDCIVELKFYSTPIASSNRDVTLSCLFKNKADLATYIDHPEHQRVAQFVRSVTQERACMDYQE